MRNWRQGLYWMGILVGGSLFVYQFVVVIEQFRITPLKSVTPEFIGLAWLCIGLATTTQIFTWANLMRFLGVELSFKELYCAYVLPFLARYLPGSIWGYIGRSIWLKQRHQISESLTNGSAILELVSLIASAIFALIVSSGILENDGLDLFSLFIGGCLLVLLIMGLVWFLLKLAVKLKVFMPKDIALAFIGWILTFCLHSILWLLHGAGLYALVSAFWNISQEMFLQLMRVFVMSWLIGFVFPFIPAGLGVRDLALSTLLVILNFSNYVASIVTLLSRGVILASELLSVLIALWLVKE